MISRKKAPNLAHAPLGLAGLTVLLSATTGFAGTKTETNAILRKAPTGANKAIRKKKAKKQQEATNSTSPDQIKSTAAAPAPASVNALDSAPTGNTNSATTASLTDKLLLNYSGAFSGPAIGNFSLFQPDPFGQDDGHIRIDNTLAAGYRISPTMSASGAFVFRDGAGGDGASLLNPFLRLNNASIFNRGGFNFGGDVRAFLPVSQAAVNSKLITAVRTNQTISWEVPGTRLTIGSYSFVQGNFFYDNAAGQNDMSLYLGPNIAYQITPKLAFTMIYEMSATHARGTGWTAFNAGIPDLEPGLSWDITPNVNFSPYINIFPGGDVSLRSSAIGATFSARFL
jgi:hypothetical protein